MVKGRGEGSLGSGQASSLVWLARGDSGPSGEPAGWGTHPCHRARLAGLHLVTSLPAPTRPGTRFKQGPSTVRPCSPGANPRAVLEVSLETEGVLTTRSLVGVPAQQVLLLGGVPGRGRVERGPNDLGRREGAASRKGSG